MPLIRIETLIAAPAGVCFDMMRDADLHAQSMKHSGERAVAGRTSSKIRWSAARSLPSSTSIDSRRSPMARE
jgi:hypothetical protein